MKTVYRGYSLDAHREPCLGGWSQLYYSAYPVDPTMPVLADDFTTGDDTVKTYMRILKERVDYYYLHPGEYATEGEDK